MGAATGQKPGKPMRQLYGSYKPDIYQYYKSHTRNKTDFAAGMEEKADDRANVLKHPLIKFGIPVAILIMAFGVMRVVAYFSTGDSNTDPPPGTPTQQSSAQTVRTADNTNARVQPSTRVRATSNQEARATHQVAFEIEPGWLPVSDKWRIVGKVNGVYWIWGEHGTRKIHSRICARFQRTGEPYCVIEGKLVTYYSYKEPQRLDERPESRSYLDTTTTEGDGA